MQTEKKSFGLSGTQIWPTMLFTRHWELFPHERQGIVEFLEQLQSQQQEQIESRIAVGSKAGFGLYESGFDLFDKQHAGLQKLVQFIRSSLATAVSIANQQEAHPQDLHVEFTDSWYHITNAGGFHDAHVHHGCSWCGIFYLQVGSSGRRAGNAAPNGGSRFYCPFEQGGGYRDYGNKYLATTVDPPMEDGQLLLFPSYLQHSGLPYQGEVNRVVIARG